MNIKLMYSSQNREDLTDYERERIRELGKCCDCGQGDLLEGPRGGCSVNVMGRNEECGSRFNLAPGLILAERISDKSPLA